MNPAQGGMRINCPQCGQPFNAPIESLIDGERNPSAKARFLRKQTNMVQCPYCQSTLQFSVPLVYHDHSKELMLIYFPMELNLPKPERERIIGEMTRTVMNSLPADQRKAYLLNPIEALTIDGMIETVLQKDGVTPEMIAAQRAKLQLAQDLLLADEADLPALVTRHDAELDEEFFQLMTLAIDALLSSGQEDSPDYLVARRNDLLQRSSYGQEVLQRMGEQEQAIQEVAQRLQRLGQNLTIDSFLDMVQEYADKDDHLQALVGLARGVFDYQFFVYLGQRIDQTKDSLRRKKLETARDLLLKWTEILDQQQQMAVQQAQMMIQQILNAPDMEQAVEENLGAFNDAVLQILAGTLQNYEQRGDLLMAARLRRLYETVMKKFQEAAPPAVRFINDLLKLEDPLEAKMQLMEHANQYGTELVAYMDAILENIAGQDSGPLYDLLTELREAAVKIVGVPQ